MKRYLAIFILCIISLLYLIGCNETQLPGLAEINIENEELLKDGELRIGCIEPSNFNPILTKSKTYSDIFSLFFNNLVEYDENQKAQYVLSSNIDIFEESGIAIVQLKDNIYWSDGNKLTAKDVKFTLDTIKSNPDSLYRSNYERISHYKVIDDETIEVRFKKPWTNILEQFAFPIIPAHIYSDKLNKTIVGTGPYKIAAYEKLKQMVLEPNELWWAKEKQLISKIRIIFINDLNAFTTAFESREIDLLHAASYDWEKYQELRDVNTYKYTSNSFEYILINHQNPLLKETNLRKSIMYAINRKDIKDRLLLGNVLLTDVPIKHNTYLYDQEALKYNYSKTEAQYILDSMDFKYNSNENIFETEVKGKVQPLKLSLMTNSENDYRRQIAEEIKKNLEEIGFVIDLEVIPFEDLYMAIKKKKFDMAIIGMDLHPEQDLYSFFHSSQIYDGNNYGSYINEEMDMLLDELQNVVSDTKRKNNYNIIQSIIRDDLPIISLFYKEHALVMRNKIKGEIKVDSEDLFRTINTWYRIK